MKHWVTLNEPYGYSVNGYSGGNFAPGRCSNYVGKCPAGDSSTEPYIVNHHLILAHGAAVNCYKNKYQVMHILINQLNFLFITKHYYFNITQVL